MTIDNVIYIWDYLTEENVCIIDALDQVSQHPILHHLPFTSSTSESR